MFLPIRLGTDLVPSPYCLYGRLTRDGSAIARSKSFCHGTGSISCDITGRRNHLIGGGIMYCLHQQTPGTFTQVIFQTKYNVTRSATRLLNAVRGRLRQLRNQTNPS